jgi:Ulp1 family protease
MPHNDILNCEFGLNICRNDLKTLSSKSWLNDQILNYYSQLILKRSNENCGLPKIHIFNTFFYTQLASKGYKSIRRWSKKVFFLILVRCI